MCRKRWSTSLFRYRVSVVCLGRISPVGYSTKQKMLSVPPCCTQHFPRTSSFMAVYSKTGPPRELHASLLFCSKIAFSEFTGMAPHHHFPDLQDSPSNRFFPIYRRENKRKIFLNIFIRNIYIIIPNPEIPQYIQGLLFRKIPLSPTGNPEKKLKNQIRLSRIFSSRTIKQICSRIYSLTSLSRSRLHVRTRAKRSRIQVSPP